ncbi:unnamed protein product [Vitrella brassicaformis CCMP3155]|uniref:Peptidase S74 domain-containing protein n=1 Tax=Vitrella brassicaformis (strain CCMP3155) TaxID=1169540 RepID=A0A0G4FXA7_VITBC|nr:unnamed protein product [Vitrella brassicaformis CCMP3155]|eukprot:CEM20033.1 unnamed protein product [Vitrella brassicaformis CCMP3155]
MRAAIVLVALALVCISRVNTVPLSTTSREGRQWEETGCEYPSGSGNNEPLIWVENIAAPGGVADNWGYIGCGNNGNIYRIFSNHVHRGTEHSLSDEKYKRSLKDLSGEFKKDAYAKFAELHLKEFQWDPEKTRMNSEEEKEQKHIGVSAQDLKQAFPDAVNVYMEAAGEGSTATDVHYVDTDYMSYLQMAVIQQLQAEVAALKAQVTKMGERSLR